MTTTDNTSCKHKYTLSFPPSFSQFYVSIPPENIFKVFGCFGGVLKCSTGNN